MFDEEEDIGFVICASCGARIKANRERCLRCEAPLVAWRKPELLPSWLQRLGGGTLVFTVVGLLASAFIVVMYLDSTSETADSIARGVPNASAARPAGIPGTSNAATGPVALSTIEPVAFLEAPGRGTASALGDVGAARARYEESLRTKPDDSEVLNNLGLTLERLGQFDAAIVRFERAVQVNPQSWAYHFNLAHASGQRQNWERTAAEYRLAVGLAPSDQATQYNLALALHRKGDEAAAIPEFQKAIELGPSNPVFHLSLAVSLEKAGRAADAQREYLAYVELAPSATNADRVKEHAQSLSGQPR